MRQDVVCPHCQKSFHVHFKSFLLGRLECPALSWPFPLDSFLDGLFSACNPCCNSAGPSCIRRTDRLPAYPVYSILFISAVLDSQSPDENSARDQKAGLI